MLHFYKVNFWDLPDQNLVPPVPGRADYIHYLADLLNVDDSHKINILDIGTGASLIYPLIGSSVYNWNFIATDSEPKSIKVAQKIIDENLHLRLKIILRLQSDKNKILSGIVNETDYLMP